MSVRWRFEDYSAEVATKVAAATAGALGDGAEFLLQDANRTVPIEEGTLERSGAVSVDPFGLQAAVSYDTPYAARQHEETRYRHDPGRRAKWLELSLKERAVDLVALIAASIRGRLRVMGG